jgi:enoyl-CoA hydratase
MPLEALRNGSDILLFIENMMNLVIAAISGWTSSEGCKIALACDLRVCTDNERFGQPEVRLEIIPGYGATVRLPRLIDSGRAKELISTGGLNEASEAARIGLVNSVVPEQKLMKGTTKIPERLSRGPAPIRFAKKTINKAFDLDTKEASELASSFHSKIYATKDSKEGITAYLEKRKALFQEI